jgi:hypothetical protein
MSQATFATHEVFNQSPPFEGIDLYASTGRWPSVAANGGASPTTSCRSSAALGLGGDGGTRPRCQREHAETAHLRFHAATAATRSSFIRPITS